MIGGYSEGYLLKRAEEIVADKEKGSRVFNTEMEAQYPRFHSSETHLGNVLGRGGFCVVSEISKITLREEINNHKSKKIKRLMADEDQITDSTFVHDRAFLGAHYLRRDKNPRYCIKALSREVVVSDDPHTFINGIVDLAIEARFLAAIRHPHIIKMRAVAMSTPFSRGFFLVLDRLYDILSRRLNWWAKRKITGVKKFVMDRKGKKKIAFWLERITVGYDLACAINYLHKINILYRDLKPDNIGFDSRGEVKIFDFGLAKELRPENKLDDGTYKLTSDTGSPRYMAPEVALGQTYNETSDIYSFGILLWQLCQMETPFDGFTVRMFEKKVIRGGVRPRCDPKWPEPVTKLMQRCWSTSIKQRPASMEEAAKVLYEEISKNNSDEEIFALLEESRSEFSFATTMTADTKSTPH